MSTQMQVSVFLKLWDQMTAPAKQAAASLKEVQAAANNLKASTNFGSQMAGEFDKATAAARRLEEAQNRLTAARNKMIAPAAAAVGAAVPIKKAADHELNLLRLLQVDEFDIKLAEGRDGKSPVQMYAKDASGAIRMTGAGINAMQHMLIEAQVELDRVSHATFQSSTDLLKAYNVMVAQGVDRDVAKTLLDPIGRAATASGSDIEALGQSAFRMWANLKVHAQDMPEAFDILHQFGKMGGFELKDSAQWFPLLGAQWGTAMQPYLDKAKKELSPEDYAKKEREVGLGMVTELGGMLQLAHIGAANAGDAATNVKYLMQKAGLNELSLHVAKFLNPNTLDMSEYGITPDQFISGREANKQLLGARKKWIGGDITAQDQSVLTPVTSKKGKTTMVGEVPIVDWDKLRFSEVQQKGVSPFLTTIRMASKVLEQNAGDPGKITKIWNAHSELAALYPIVQKYNQWKGMDKEMQGYLKTGDFAGMQEMYKREKWDMLALNKEEFEKLRLWSAQNGGAVPLEYNFNRFMGKGRDSKGVVDRDFASSIELLTFKWKGLMSSGENFIRLLTSMGGLRPLATIVGAVGDAIKGLYELALAFPKVTEAAVPLAASVFTAVASMRALNLLGALTSLGAARAGMIGMGSAVGIAAPVTGGFFARLTSGVFGLLGFLLRTALLVPKVAALFALLGISATAVFSGGVAKAREALDEFIPALKPYTAMAVQFFGDAANFAKVAWASVFNTWTSNKDKLTLDNMRAQAKSFMDDMATWPSRIKGFLFGDPDDMTSNGGWLRMNVPWLMSAIDSVKAKASQMWGDFNAKYPQFGATVQAATTKVQSLWSATKTMLRNAGGGDALAAVRRAIVGEGTWTEAWGKTKSFFSNLGQLGKAAIFDLFGTNNWMGVWEGLKSAFWQAMSFIRAKALETWEFIKAIVTGGSYAGASGPTGPLFTWMQGQYEGVKRMLQEIWTIIQPYAQPIIDALRVVFEPLWNMLKPYLMPIKDGIMGLFKDFGANATGANGILGFFKALGAGLLAFTGFSIFTKGWSGFLLSLMAVRTIAFVIGSVFSALSLITSLAGLFMIPALDRFFDSKAGVAAMGVLMRALMGLAPALMIAGYAWWFHNDAFKGFFAGMAKPLAGPIDEVKKSITSMYKTLKKAIFGDDEGIYDARDLRSGSKSPLAPYYRMLELGEKIGGMVKTIFSPVIWVIKELSKAFTAFGQTKFGSALLGWLGSMSIGVMSAVVALGVLRAAMVFLGAGVGIMKFLTGWTIIMGLLSRFKGLWTALFGRGLTLFGMGIGAGGVGFLAWLRGAFPLLYSIGGILGKTYTAAGLTGALRVLGAVIMRLPLARFLLIASTLASLGAAFQGAGTKIDKNGNVVSKSISEMTKADVGWLGTGFLSSVVMGAWAGKKRGIWGMVAGAFLGAATDLYMNWDLVKNAVDYIKKDYPNLSGALTSIFSSQAFSSGTTIASAAALGMMVGGPVGAILFGGGAAIYEAYQNWDKIKQLGKDIEEWALGKETTGDYGETTRSGGLMERFSTWMSGQWQLAGNLNPFKGLGDKLAADASSVWAQINQALWGSAQTDEMTGNQLQAGIFTRMGDMFRNGWATAGDWFTGLGPAIMTGIGNGLDAAWTGLVGKFDAFIAKLKAKLNDLNPFGGNVAPGGPILIPQNFTGPPADAMQMTSPLKDVSAAGARIEAAGGLIATKLDGASLDLSSAGSLINGAGQGAASDVQSAGNVLAQAIIAIAAQLQAAAANAGSGSAGSGQRFTPPSQAARFTGRSQLGDMDA